MVAAGDTMDLTSLDIDSITDVNEIKRLHGLLQKEEQKVDGELDTILDNNDEMTARILSVQRLLPNLEVLSKEANHLTDVISKTSSLAEKVSSKVRELDLVKGRVQETIKRVDDILDLKSCVEGVQMSFQKEEYEQAAAFIHRYLSLDERAMREILPVDTEEADLNASFTYLHEAQEKLQNTVRSKFEGAVVSRNRSQVERYFKLFPLVGMQDEGLLKFSKYLRTQISELSEGNMDVALNISPQDRRANVIFADTLTLLFEGIAKIVEEHQPLVDTFYGPGKMLSVLKELQGECDSQSKYIVQQFLNSRKFEVICESLSKSSTKQKGTEVNEKLDAKELDILLGEIVLLSSRTELYQNFIKNRLQSDFDALPEDEEPQDLKKWEDCLISNSGLSRKLQTLMGDYIVMEGYFMREMMDKAIAMDDCDVESQTSSMVDDIFFVLQKSLRRALLTGNINIMCAVLNNATSMLTSNYRTVLKDKLEETGFPSNTISSMLTRKTTEADLLKSKRQFLVVLNNLDISSDYLKKLINDLMGECSKKLKQAESDKDKLESCFIDLGACAQVFKEILQGGVSQLCANAIMPRLVTIIDGFSSTSHVLTEEDYSFYEVNDPFVQNLIATMDSILAILKNALTTSNYESSIGLVCHELATRLEKVVMKSSFNRLGGLQFDKELRSLIQYLTSITEWTVRDKFARLSQVATILNLEKVHELLDYWGGNSGPLTWRLTPGEVRTILALRNDFRNEDIQRLKL